MGAKIDYEGQAKKKIDDYDAHATEQAQKKIDQTNNYYDNLIEKAESDTAYEIKKTEDDYWDIVNAADVQKELDIRNIRETRANMGLSRSGLSATEQTAAILSAGNKVSKAQRQKQSAIDALNKSLLDYKKTTESERTSAILSTEQERDSAMFTNKDKWETWSFENTTADEKTRVSGLESAYDNGLIDYDTYQAALEDGSSAMDAKNAYAPTKEQKDNQILFATWLQENYIEPDLYNRAIAENMTPQQVIVEQEKINDENEKKAEAEQLNADLLTMLQNQYIDYDLYTKAKTDGMTLEQVIVEQTRRNEESDKKDAVTQRNDYWATQYMNGNIGKDLFEKILANPDLSNADIAKEQRAWQESEAKKAEAEQLNADLLTMLQSGYLTSDLYTKAKTDGMTLEQVIVEQTKRNEEAGKNDALTQRINYYTEEFAKGNISRKVFLKFLENPNMSDAEVALLQDSIDSESDASSAAYKRLDNELSRAVENGDITEHDKEEALLNGYSLEYTIALSTARNKLKTSSRKAAAIYLRDNTDLDEDEVEQIASTIGLSVKDFENLPIIETSTTGNGQTTTNSTATSDSSSKSTSKTGITTVRTGEVTFWEKIADFLGISNFTGDYHA